MRAASGRSTLRRSRTRGAQAVALPIGAARVLHPLLVLPAG